MKVSSRRPSKLSSMDWSNALRFACSLPERSWAFRSDGCVTIPSPARLTQWDKTASQNGPAAIPDISKEIKDLLSLWKPWRKGPFEIYQTRIEANWKSNLKWTRLHQILTEEIESKSADLRICDVGANNGYFLFALQDAFQPKRLVGLDPVPEFYQCFRFLKELSNFQEAEFLPYGFQELIHFPNYFDVIVCMGVIYHHTDPVRLLRILHAALRKGGLLVLESLCVSAPQDDFPSVLVPKGRYAGMRGVWNVPTGPALESWLVRSSFGKIRLWQTHEYLDEQIRTKWGDLPGLAEVLDSKDPSLTIEGYPAPRRIWFSARKG